MHFLSTVILFGSACAVAATSAGQRSSFMAMKGIFEREAQVCQPVTPPVTCERSCGPGNIQCIKFSNCYNPSAGETCCSNGDYCPARTYCTDAGCCPDGSSLADCGAAVSLSIIPPSAESTSASSAEPTSSAVVTTGFATTTPSSPTTSPTTSDTSTSPATSDTSTPLSSTSTTTSPTPATSKKASVTSKSNSTATTLIVVQTTGAGQKLGSGVVHIALGGLGVLFMIL